MTRAEEIQPVSLTSAELARVQPGDLLVVVLPEEWSYVDSSEAAEAKEGIQASLPEGAQLVVLSHHFRAIVVSGGAT